MQLSKKIMRIAKKRDACQHLRKCYSIPKLIFPPTPKIPTPLYKQKIYKESIITLQVFVLRIIAMLRMKRRNKLAYYGLTVQRGEKR